jgi:hypothetical protein
MVNESKPSVATPETYLNVGDGYKLTIGGVYSLIVGALGLGGMTNAAKASIGETWGMISTSWASETQNWEEASQLISNSARTSSSITNFNKP